ncbi:hypothetical protein [Kozakia baliensis]|uniref:hypothetical protein n=1 Tax=Kozakia baliensis TaxID=153496 RepID=UPI0012465E93|nr:hypothetical protein [Kozakia baliensis]
MSQDAEQAKIIAYNAGFVAAYMDHPMDTNPHHYPREDYFQWIHGYRDAREQRKERERIVEHKARLEARS